MTARRAVFGFVLLLAAPAAHAGDPQGAERQYRIARRLAAEGSPEAGPALRRVIELDPQGALADDALLELALLEPLPRWPEELGALEPEQARRGGSSIERVLAEHGSGNRAREARYYRAMLRLEPLDSWDPAAARLDLLELATHQDADSWGESARLLIAWLAEHRGDLDRARAAYQRLVIESPRGGPAAGRAAQGLARLDLVERRPGRAAARIQEELSTGEEPQAKAVADLRDLSVRALLRSAGVAPAPAAPEVVALPGVRAPAAFVVLPDGTLLAADRREGTLVAVRTDGTERHRFELDGLQAVAANELGRVVVAAGDRLLRVAPGRSPRPVASLGSMGPLSGLALDALGRAWLLDRRGERIGRVDPGAAAPITYWESNGERLIALCWDGRRLLAIDDRSRALVEVTAGGVRPVAEADLRRPLGLASDPAGRVAVLDGKLGAVVFFEDGREVGARFDTAVAGIAKPLAIDFGPDGALHLFDGDDQTWVRVP